MLQAGAMLGGRYVLHERIASGGMGDVWRGEDTLLRRPVALKVLLPGLSADPGFAARFRAEAHAMAALSHPGIVEIYDYDHTDSTAYLVMQYVNGESLQDMLERLGRLRPEHVMTLLAQAANALHMAHAKGIVHRDVKPGNLLVRTDGRLVLTDFGIARMVATDRLTDVDEIIGTAAYLAPEQVTGTRVTPATDIYALGVVAYECLAGRQPFVADRAVEVAVMHTSDEPPPLPSDVPEPIRKVVLRALAKDPANRWNTAAAFAQAMTSAAAPPPPPARQPPSPPSPPPAPPTPVVTRLEGEGIISPAHAAGSSGRRRLVFIAAAIVLLAGVTGFVVLGRDSPGAPGPGAGASRPPEATALEPSPEPTDAGPSTPRPSPTHSAPATTTGTSATTRPPATTPPTDGPQQPPPTTAPPSSDRPVPPVVGLREAEARTAIVEAGLVPSVQYQPTLAQCTVLTQSPAPATVVAANSTVTIVVGQNDLCPPT